MRIEKWDILNADGSKTGKKTIRGKGSLQSGEYHLVVHIWIVSSNGKLLIQRRSDSKKLMPGEWAATGGAAISGEDSYTAANRELYEELGIPSNKKNLVKLTRIKRRNSLLDIWALMADIPIERLVLQKSEVAEARWVEPKELKRMISEGKYHNYGDEYFQTVFSKIEDYQGARV